MTLTKLSTGFWFARWSREVWAQWPVGRLVSRADFFHPAWSYTPEREREANVAAEGQQGEAGR